MSANQPIRSWLTAGDVGVPIELDFMQARRPFTDAATALSITLTFKSPHGVTFTRTVTVDAPPAPQNRVKYISQAGDFDDVGIWSVGATILFEDGRRLSVPCDTSTTFMVKRKAPE